MQLIMVPITFTITKVRPKQHFYMAFVLHL